MPRAKITDKAIYNGHPTASNYDGQYKFNAHMLDRIDQSIKDAESKFPRTYAFRFDLRYPNDSEYPHDNKLISLFAERFVKDRKRNGYDTQLVWATEQGKKASNLHHHAIALMNGRDVQSPIRHFSKAEDIWADLVDAPKGSALLDRCQRDEVDPASRTAFQ